MCKSMLAQCLTRTSWLVFAAIVISVPVTATSSCSLSVDCNACANSGFFSCSYPSNKPADAPTIGCCCPGPSGGTCAQSCGGCGTRWQNPDGSIGTSCISRSCQGGVSCSTWTCAANRDLSRSGAEVAQGSRHGWHPRLLPVAMAQVDTQSLASGGIVEITSVGAEDAASPLRVTSARLTASGNYITGVTYRLTNQGSTSVIAAKSELRFRDVNGSQSAIMFSFDGFVGGADIRPGQSLELTSSFKQELKSPLKSLAMIVTFALTDGGQPFGRNAHEIASDLEDRYREQLRGYDRVSKAIASAPSGGEIDAVRSVLAQLGETKACSDTLAILSEAFNRGVLDGLKQALGKKRKLW